ncbi:multiheme c-type cytochrome [Jhaorihella thermophila]|uniref:multiheme c-type cytochrome n=1 Tax=Jhaorihella thermophila TaxID=488547 RepID=UPI003616A986
MTHLFIMLPVVAAMLATTASAQQKSTEAPHYVGSASCAACHATESAAWEGSDHALAWTEPSPDTVLGDFDDAETTLDGARVRLSTEGGAYMVSITRPDGTEARYPVHSVAGVRPLQQYLLETEPGRLQSFDLAWDTRGQRWYDLYPDQDLNPGDGLHWTGPYKNWNGRCAECHATGFRKNYDPRTRRYASSQAEMGVGCEACHGPGSRHVDWAERNRETPVAPPEHYGFTMDFATAGTEALIQQCAGCHSRREPLGDGNPLPGTAFSDAYRLVLLRPGLYHADGQILDEVYVYGSFLQSKMYARGVGCMNCHEPHSATLRAPDNTLCTQCHSPAGNPDFPTLPKRLYDDPAHHFHETGSPGAQCKSCHMIERTYMGVDGRRDHSFRIPRPDLDRVTGAPDACTDCHADRSPDWAAAEIAKRHPRSAARPHYGVTLARGRADPQAARTALLDLAGDTGQPGVVRATALWLVEQRADRPAADRAATMLDDPDPLVRAAAIGVQKAAGQQDRVQRVLPRLNDPAKMVRIQAAKALLGVPIAHMPERMAASMRRAMSEWQRSLVARADFPKPTW